MTDVTVTGAATPWPVVVTVAATAGNGIPTGVNGQTIVFSPNVNGVTPVATSQGAIDWACTSLTASDGRQPWSRQPLPPAPCWPSTRRPSAAEQLTGRIAVQAERRKTPATAGVFA